MWNVAWSASGVLITCHAWMRYGVSKPTRIVALQRGTHPVEG